MRVAICTGKFALTSSPVKLGGVMEEDERLVHGAVALQRASPYVIASGAARLTDALIAFKATARDTNGALSVSEFELGPWESGPVLHLHETVDEAIYVVAGRWMCSSATSGTSRRRVTSYGCREGYSTRSRVLETTRSAQLQSRFPGVWRTCSSSRRLTSSRPREISIPQLWKKSTGGTRQ